MSSRTHPWTRLTLAGALALGLAVAPSAQQMAPADSDTPGVPILALPPSSGDFFFDDQDPATRAQARPTSSPSNALATGALSYRLSEVVSDADDPTFPMAFPEASQAQVEDGPLSYGRDGLVAAPRVVGQSVALDEMAVVGRTQESLAAARNRIPSPELRVEALDNGRPPGMRPGPIPASADDAPVEIAAPLVDVADVATSDGLTLSVVQPNPARTEAWVTASVDASTRATVRVYDIQGREVVTAFDGFMVAEAPTRVRLDLREVSAGTYIVVFDADGVRSTQTLQVVR